MTGLRLTPGSIFLLKGLLLFTVPPILIYHLLHRALLPLLAHVSSQSAPYLSDKTVLALALVAVPLYYAIQVFVTMQYHRYRACKLGARIIATPGTGVTRIDSSTAGEAVRGLEGRWPGNCGVLK
ncbi:hypothetical protein BDV98DRAFT_305219 [Pterulicium gracile]|uniref:Uncharacterized protein n=1 Tax=Pterulicium gracile TaxID=1884261 RepID=A0A5C3Q387_9AGAR|nr:hypothetical protein BDV98DRAFT_305219 [Pterula gracilis]